MDDNTGWVVGFVIGGIVVVAVVALVVPILVLAGRIAKDAWRINASLGESVRNTAGLAKLNTTIEHATVIIAGLERGRHRLGG
jgi:hypothetical protein